MDKIKVKNALIAVSNKASIDGFLPLLAKAGAKIWATEGTAKYIKSKGYKATSIVCGFDFDGRVKTLDRQIFIRILNDRSKKRHHEELRKLGLEPFDLVIVDLYKLDARNFPESMDIGGQALIRAAVKNYRYVTVAFNKETIADLVKELQIHKGSTTLAFRKKQASNALRFVAERAGLEANLEL